MIPSAEPCAGVFGKLRESAKSQVALTWKCCTTEPVLCRMAPTGTDPSQKFRKDTSLTPLPALLLHSSPHHPHPRSGRRTRARVGCSRRCGHAADELSEC